MSPGTFTTEGAVANVMIRAGTVLYREPGFHVLRIASGDDGFHLGLHCTDTGRLAVLDGPGVVAALRRALAR